MHSQTKQCASTTKRTMLFILPLFPIIPQEIPFLTSLIKNIFRVKDGVVRLRDVRIMYNKKKSIPSYVVTQAKDTELRFLTLAGFQTSYMSQHVQWTTLSSPGILLGAYKDSYSSKQTILMWWTCWGCKTSSHQNWSKALGANYCVWFVQCLIGCNTDLTFCIQPYFVNLCIAKHGKSVGIS